MTTTREEFPQRVDLRETLDQHPLPISALGAEESASITGEEATQIASGLLDKLSAALTADDTRAVENCFLDSRSYWKDQLALTYHLRTFKGAGMIAEALVETKRLRGISGGIKLKGDAKFIAITPSLQYVECWVTFRTSSPGATCSGRMLIFPVRDSSESPSKTVEWKVWTLGTFVEGLDVHPEDENLLQAPGKQLDGDKTIETDVIIIGGGNAAISLAARLKTLGIENVMVEQNAEVGGNWTLRYDCLKFHVPTSCCALPYMAYPDELQAPHLLSRIDLANHVRRYVAAFNLNMVNSAKIQRTEYNQRTKQWMVKFQTPDGNRTAVSKHLVQATGINSRIPHLPTMLDSHLYKGISLHSAQYTNAEKLKEKGVKTVFIVGSANTAFDILEDCHLAGLQATMIVRSPTHIIPIEHVVDKRSLGAYDRGVEEADRSSQTVPTFVDCQMSRMGLSSLVAEKPDRYAALAAAGFPVFDSSHPDALLMHHLIERGGGHYVDIGGTKLIVEGKVGLKVGLEPVAYTATGLQFSDGSTADADAVVWCTGFADKDARSTAADILGGGGDADNTNIGGDSVEGKDDDAVDGHKDLLGPRDIAARLDNTWSVDVEGEIRGMWKRHLRLDNYWVMGGFVQQHRWHSRTLALQIKAALEGILPPAYRETPVPKDQD